MSLHLHKIHTSHHSGLRQSPEAKRICAEHPEFTPRHEDFTVTSNGSTTTHHIIRSAPAQLPQLSSYSTNGYDTFGR